MDWNKAFKKILFPPAWVMIVLTVLSAAALTFIFVKGLDESPVAYAVYVIAFYTLSVICIFFSMVLPKRYKAIKQRIYDNPIGHRYMTDVAFRTHISLYTSLVVNLLYAAINIVSFLLYRSVWFIVLSFYYVILAVMRFLLVRYVRRVNIGENRLGELKRAILCSSILLSLNFVLTGAVLMILYQNKGYNYHGMLIYIIAGYTFYITTHAIIDLVKYRKHGSPVMTTAKVIALSAALVSILNLETAMFSQFGADMSLEDQRLMIALTGAGVSIIVVTMSVYMIIKSAKEIKTLENNEYGKQRAERHL